MLNWRRIGLHCGLAVVSLIVAMSAAKAGDFAHSCATADGAYLFNDGQLTRNPAFEPDASRAPQNVPHRVLKRVPLTSRESVCVVTSGPRRGKRYANSFEAYLLVFKINGEDFVRTALCELAASGLPADAACDREEVSRDWSADIANRSRNDRSIDFDEALPADKRKSSLWRLGQSQVRLWSHGAARRLVIETADGDLAERGYRSGDVLFVGARAGLTMTGTLFVRHANCGVQAVPATGTIARSQVAFDLAATVTSLRADCQGRGRQKLAWDLRFLNR